MKKVYISREKVDMRKSINGLAAIVQERFDLDAYTGALFVFMNGNKTRLKILQWDKDGFALYYKRREKGRFYWPEFDEGAGAITISQADLDRLLDGLVMEQFVPKISYASA
ncbi:MAG: IS66 family insertion sequence element accessory protein TnpB [Synergistaceae bacterium]|nr:IS66 family insertion sequence element accessory protein TnpB [Synergistaceae bacterium]